MISNNPLINNENQNWHGLCNVSGNFGTTNQPKTNTDKKDPKMTNLSKFQSNVFAAVFALAMSAVFVGISVLPAETGTVVAMIA